jgi:sulfite reductase alpha subunit-like flavoprotein
VWTLRRGGVGGGGVIVEQLAHRGGCMMVCGGTQMGLAVQAAVVRAMEGATARSESGEGHAAAEAWMDGLVSSGHYVQELWS